MFSTLPKDWQAALSIEFKKPYLSDLEAFVTQRRSVCEVYPPKKDLFQAFEHTPFDKVSVVILGQDPYANPSQAHGLSFSVKTGVCLPKSLQNIFKELNQDLEVNALKEGCLLPWAKQGVLLLNSILTVEKGLPLSHQGQGWERFTDAVISTIAQHRKHVVFILWGASAQKKAALIPSPPHTIITGAHPSPLSAYRGFFGTRPFSKTNQALRQHGQKEIHWCSSLD